MSLTPFQLVHGPSTKTRVAYILSLLCDPAGVVNDSTLMEDDEDDSDIEDGDITMLNTEVIFIYYYLHNQFSLLCKTCQSMK